jgi:hypothetical protein
MLKLGLLSIIKLTAVAMFLGSLLTSASVNGLPLQDPWFDIAIFLWVFSAITGGMPEPEQNSSFWYIWLYRTLHLMSASATAYFIHKNRWSDISGGESTSSLIDGKPVK